MQNALNLLNVQNLLTVLNMLNVQNLLTELNMLNVQNLLTVLNCAELCIIVLSPLPGSNGEARSLRLCLLS